MLMKLIDTLFASGEELNFEVGIESENVFKKFGVGWVILDYKYLHRVLFVHTFGYSVGGLRNEIKSTFLHPQLF
jgi:hypothetical protein